MNVEKAEVEKRRAILAARAEVAVYVDQSQIALDSEVRARLEAERSTKKIESDLNDLKIKLSTAQRQTVDAQKMTKELVYTLTHVNDKKQDCDKIIEGAQESNEFAERRVAFMSQEVNELRTAVDDAEKARKRAQQKLDEANLRANMLTEQNVSYGIYKQKIETELTEVKAEAEVTLAKCEESRPGYEIETPVVHYRSCSTSLLLRYGQLPSAIY